MLIRHTILTFISSILNKNLFPPLLASFPITLFCAHVSFIQDLWCLDLFLFHLGTSHTLFSLNEMFSCPSFYLNYSHSFFQIYAQAMISKSLHVTKSNGNWAILIMTSQQYLIRHAILLFLNTFFSRFCRNRLHFLPTSITDSLFWLFICYPKSTGWIFSGLSPWVHFLLLLWSLYGSTV